MRSPPKSLSFFKDDEFQAYIDWYYFHFMRLCDKSALGWELAKVQSKELSKYFFRKSSKTDNAFLKKRYLFLGKLFWKWFRCFERGEFPPPYKPLNSK